MSTGAHALPLTTTSYATTDRRLLRVMTVAAGVVLAVTAVGSTLSTGPGTATPPPAAPASVEVAAP